MGRNGNGKGILVAVIIILVVINVVGLGGMYLLFKKNMKAINSGKEPTTTATPMAGGDEKNPAATPGGSSQAGNNQPGNDSQPGNNGQNNNQNNDNTKHDPEPAKHVENLKDEIANAKLPEGTTAVVSVFDGKEYLKITIDSYVIYYKNDYVKYGTEPYGEVIIERGLYKKVFNWDYSLDAENIPSLVPSIGSWVGNNYQQMAFVFKKMGDSEDERTSVHFVSCLDFIEYTVMKPEYGLNDVISIEGFAETEEETLVCLLVDSKKYFISAGKKLGDMEKAQMSLSPSNDIRYYLSGEKVYLNTKVEIAGIGWIGELVSRVSCSSYDIFGNQSGATLYCYVDQQIKEHEEILVVTPLKNYEDTKRRKATVTSDKGEKMIFFAKDDIAASWQDSSLFTVDEDGHMKYGDPSVYSALGVDVSKFNTVTDWKKVKAAGFDFAIVRMGYRGYGTGAMVTDATFESHVEGALNAGMDVGVYFFTQAISVEEAVEEANYVIDAIKKYNIKYPVIFDTEGYSGVDARANKMSVQLRTDIIKAFCNTVKTAGYTPMIYSSTEWSLLRYDRSQLEDFDFWFAYYGTNVTYPYHYEMLQYSESCTVPGVTKPLDVNICFKQYK